MHELKGLIGSPEVRNLVSLLATDNERAELEQGVYDVEAQGRNAVLAHNDEQGVLEELDARVDLMGVESISAAKVLGMLTAIQVYRARSAEAALDLDKLKVGMSQ